MSDVITRETLADLFEVAIPSGAATMRSLADEENRELIADAADYRDFWDGFDDDAVAAEIGKVLRKVNARTGENHNPDCWKAHAPCLALKLNALIVGDE